MKADRGKRRQALWLMRWCWFIKKVLKRIMINLLSGLKNTIFKLSKVSGTICYTQWCRIASMNGLLIVSEVVREHLHRPGKLWCTKLAFVRFDNLSRKGCLLTDRTVCRTACIIILVLTNVSQREVDTFDFNCVALATRRLLTDWRLLLFIEYQVLDLWLEVQAV